MSKMVPSVIDPRTGKQLVVKGPAPKTPVGKKPIITSDKMKLKLPVPRAKGGIIGLGGKSVNPTYNTY